MNNRERFMCLKAGKIQFSNVKEVRNYVNSKTSTGNSDVDWNNYVNSRMYFLYQKLSREEKNEYILNLSKESGLNVVIYNGNPEIRDDRYFLTLGEKEDFVKKYQHLDF
jgi:hypothetical protein